MPATAPDAKTLAKRTDLCGELLELRKKNAPVFDRIEQINTQLKQMANELGRGFRETDPTVGYVSVSGAKGEEFKGDFPVVDVRKLQALTPAKRQKLYDDGILVTQSEWSKPYYGQVSVTLF